MQAVSERKNLKVVDLVYSGLFATLMMIGANITAFVPFLMIGGVPITFQSFFAILAGLLLGAKRGALACMVYMLVGLAGAPVFAKFGGGFSSLLMPTFGFVVSFILAAYVAGWIAARWKTKAAYVVAAVVALLINYLVGTNWLYVAYMFWFGAPEGFTYSLAWVWMAAPFVKDIVLLVFGGFFAYRLQKVLKIMPVK